MKNNSDSVLLMKEYGFIKVNLEQQLKKQGVTMNYLARCAGVNYIVVKKWCKGGLERIDADVLARFCFVLKCQVGDLLEYTDINRGPPEF